MILPVVALSPKRVCGCFPPAPQRIQGNATQGAHQPKGLRRARHTPEIEGQQGDVPLQGLRQPRGSVRVDAIGCVGRQAEGGGGGATAQWWGGHHSAPCLRGAGWVQKQPLAEGLLPGFESMLFIVKPPPKIYPSRI